MSEASSQRIVIRRKKKAVHGHHGGAWKIAYADFVTAMMAFFLVMWLISLMPQEKLEGIADYFRRPLVIPFASNASSDGAIPGGGIDPSRVQGNIRRSDEPPARNVPTNAAERAERLRFEAMKRRLDNLIETSPVLKHFRPQLLLDITTEGLRIQIVDTQNRPMFATGRAEVQAHMREILRELAPVLNEMPNRISIAGHTDATQYQRGEQAYSNWELSGDRANASRRELVAGGLQEGKVMRMMGMAASMSVVKDNPYAAVNRRISLVVLNRRTEHRIETENAAASKTDVVVGQVADVAHDVHETRARGG